MNNIVFDNRDHKDAIAQGLAEERESTVLETEMDVVMAQV